MFLYNEQILIVDLEQKTTEIMELDLEMIEGLVGGAAISIKLLEIYKDKEPLVIGTGPLTGTLAPGGALALISSIGDSGEMRHIPMTQFIGAEIKYSGFDFIVIHGSAAQPVYLWIHDGVANIDDATNLWGEDIWTTVDNIKQEKGDDLVQVLAIGPAGERKHPNAQFSQNYWSSLDSFGFGKIFGDKNLKAICLRGLGIIDAEEIDEMMEESVKLQKEITALSSLSLGQGISQFAAAEDKGELEEWLQPIIHRHKSCFGCVIACSTFVKYNEDPSVMESTSVTEPGFLLTNYKAISTLQKHGITAEDASRILETCARLGIDPNAASALIAAEGIKGWEKGSEVIKEQLKKNVPIGEQGTNVPGKRDLLGLILGICPELLHRLPEEMGLKFLKVASLGTGIDFTAEFLGELMEKQRSDAS